MNEPLEQSMAGETGQEQSLELADRLLRRRTEPVGVINTHHPQQMYDRTAGLVARRFAMLDHWRTRYASAENSAASKSDVGGDFALTSAPLAALREKVAAAPPLSPRSVTPGSSAQTSAQVPTQASPTAASPMMRVMRRAARPADAAQPSSTPSSHLPIIGGGFRQGSIQRGETPSAAAATPARMPVRVGRMEVSPSALPLRLQRTPDEAPTGLARRRELTAPPVSTATARMPLSESAARRLPPSANPLREPPSLLGGDGATREATDSVAERTGLAAIGAALTRVESPSSLPLVQRQPAGGARVVETSSKPVMVWQRSAEGSSSGGAGSALPLAISAARGGEPRVARQTMTAESTSSARPEGSQPVTTTPMPPGPSASEIDVVHLAEQVSRLIARQLAVERERRGRSGWR